MDEAYLIFFPFLILSNTLKSKIEAQCLFEPIDIFSSTFDSSHKITDANSD